MNPENRVLGHAPGQHAARTIEAVDLALEDVAANAEQHGTGAGQLAP